LILLLVYFSCIGQQKVIPLYNGTIPNSKKTLVGYVEGRDSSGFIVKVSIPTLTAFFPGKTSVNGTAVIIAPGGGYEVWVDEGADVAKAFNKIGVAAFVLKYRLPSDEIMIDKSLGPCNFVNAN